MAPKHSDVVRKEIYDKVKADIITPAASAWSFLVVVETKKDVIPRFCVDYRVLNAIMKAERFPLPKIEISLMNSLEAASSV